MTSLSDMEEGEVIRLFQEIVKELRKRGWNQTAIDDLSQVGLTRADLY